MGMGPESRRQVQLRRRRHHVLPPPLAADVARAYWPLEELCKFRAALELGTVIVGLGWRDLRTIRALPDRIWQGVLTELGGAWPGEIAAVRRRRGRFGRRTSS